MRSHIKWLVMYRRRCQYGDENLTRYRGKAAALIYFQAHGVLSSASSLCR